MGKVIILSVIICIGIARWLISKQKMSSDYLLISLFVQTIPFDFGKAIYTYLEGVQVDDNVSEILGAFGNSIRLEMSMVFAILFLFLGFTRLKEGVIPRFKTNKWFYIFLTFLLISYFNPYNIYQNSIFPPLFSFLQLLFLLNIIKSNFTLKEILRALYDGIMLITGLQAILSICYPVLGIEAAATLFRGDEALEWSERRGSMSAIGTFGHPGGLALFCLIAGIFFLACYFNKYKPKMSLFLLGVNICVIFLTFSRTTYVSTVAILLLLYFVQRQGRKVFEIGNIIKILGSFLLLIAILYLTPLSDMFLKSDASDQVDNRMAHVIFGYEIWKNSEILGVGINSHVYFMINKLNISLKNMNSKALAFLIRSPIHDIHIIVLAETGLLGLFTWVYYFASRIIRYSKCCHTEAFILNIFNLTFVGSLSSIFLYGFFGWTPFHPETYTFVIFLGFFASNKIISNIKKNSRIQEVKVG